MSRNAQLIRQWRLIGLLAKGRSRTVADFDVIRRACNVTKKTLSRDIEAILDVPEFQIITYRRDGVVFYRMDGGPWIDCDDTVPKKCNKCTRTGLVRSDFYKNKNAPDGRRNICRHCLYEYNKGWDKANRRRRNTYARNRNRRIAVQRNARRRQLYALKNKTIGNVAVV